jgi:hypothetical protein
MRGLRRQVRLVPIFRWFEHGLGWGQGFFKARGRAGQLSIRPGNPKLLMRFPEFKCLDQNVASESRTLDRPTNAITHIVFLGWVRCVNQLPLLSGRCVPPASIGWDWQEFLLAYAALSSVLSNAPHAIALRKFLTR